MHAYLRSVSLGLLYIIVVIFCFLVLIFVLLNNGQDIGWEEHLQNDLLSGMYM